jgi:hypothetical protein
MVTILSAVVSIFAFRFRSRASLELKLIALQHQLAVLRRQRPGAASAFISRPAAVGLAVPDLAAGHRRDDIGGDRGPMASQGLPRRSKRRRAEFHPTPAQWGAMTIEPVQERAFRSEIMQSRSFGSVDSSWTIVGTADFNGDGKA